MDWSQYTSGAGGGGGSGGSPSSSSSAEGHITFGNNGAGLDVTTIAVLAGAAIVVGLLFAIIFHK